MKTSSIVAASALAVGSTVAASPAEASSSKRQTTLPPVTVKGNAFFAGNDRFFIRGVDYQPGGSADPIDPLANPTTCKRDIAEFQKLGLNTVCVYTVDNSVNHDECMNALAEAGIYLALDVNSGTYSINNANYQLAAESYNDVYLQNVFATIDAFANYDNTLLYFSGNEVVNQASNTIVAPFVKAVTRDMKQYIGERGYRAIPVGYSAADVSQNRYQMAAYMNCGAADERSDFFAFNDYSWCDPNTFEGSGWAAEVQLYQNYSIPLFLSEYGCIKPPPRKFEEVSALYTSEMTAVYSGGLVYQYSEEATNPGFGLVNIVSPTQVTTRTDFNYLMSQFSKYPSPAGSSPYHTNLAPLDCPSKSDEWEVSGDTLPAMPAGAVKYLQNGAGPGVGLKGPGSQTAGTPSSGPAQAGSGQVTATYGSPSATGQVLSSTSSTGAAVAAYAPPFTFPAAAPWCTLALGVASLLGAGLFL